MLFSLRCHFCGSRSKFSRGTTEFQCNSCEAWNFYDKKGEVVDAPARIAAAPRSEPVQLQPSQAFAQSGRDHFAQQDGHQTFCQTCLTNQRIYTESLANYLPDDHHPQYLEYERKLPIYKADLEKRYPQICKKCAPKAQVTISRADRYGLQQNVAKNMRDTAARGGRTIKGQRDDWSKWSIRALLRMLGWALYASLLVQVAWHAYSLLTTIFLGQETELSDPDELAFDPTLYECATDLLHLRFHQPCRGILSALVSKALLTSLGLIWYFPGFAFWYHHTVRVESVFGRSQYVMIQLILLFVRTMAWANLSNASVTADLTKPQLLAAHGFMIGFVPLLQTYSEKAIRFDAWRIKGKMMKSPEEGDVFGAFAGPEKDMSQSQASSVPPIRLFERNTDPFPIENLAPRTTRSSSNRNLPYKPPPSPPDSQSDEEMQDQMDWQPSEKPRMPGAPNDRVYRPKNSQSQNIYNYGMAPQQPQGWGAMRDELYGIQSQHAAEEQRRREAAEQERLRQLELQNQSPFRGSLPQDPMQRRLRGAYPQLQKKQQPASERPDFFSEMRKSFNSSRFGKTPTKIGTLDRGQGPSTTASKKNVSFAGLSGLGLNDDDEDFSPVKHRRPSSSSNHPKGSLNVREGQWRLPDKTEATGLEDLFGGHSFRIADEPGAEASATTMARPSTWSWKVMLGVGLPVVFLAVGWNVQPIRKTVCLWLVEKLEGMGY